MTIGKQARELLASLYLGPKDMAELYPEDAQCPDQCLGRLGHPGPHQPSDYVPRSEIEAEVRANIADTVERLLRMDPRRRLDDRTWNTALQVALYVIRGDA